MAAGRHVVWFPGLAPGGSPADTDTPALRACVEAGVAAWRALAPHTPPVDAVVGHSIGLYAALVAAEAWSLDDALWAAARSAALGDALAPRGDLLGVLGPTRGEVEATCAGRGLAVSHVHGPRHHVIGGAPAALTEVQAALRAIGALATRRFGLHHAYHTDDLSAAAEALAEELPPRLAPPRVPVYLCIGDPSLVWTGGPAEVVARAMAHRVELPAVVEALKAAGASRFTEAGGGRLLERCVRHVDAGLGRWGLGGVGAGLGGRGGAGT